MRLPPVTRARIRNPPKSLASASNECWPLCGAGAAIHYLGFRYFDRTWYQGEKRDSIRWLNDWSGDTYLNLDKGGHFMGGIFLSSLFSNAYSWAGFDTGTSTALGTLTSWGALFEIEMRDAYFVHWGFSIPDFFFNTLGATVPLVYAACPPSRAFGFKFSYWPSPLYLERVQRSRAQQPHTRSPDRRLPGHDLLDDGGSRGVSSGPGGPHLA